MPPTPESMKIAWRTCLPTWPMACQDKWEEHITAVAEALDQAFLAGMDTSPKKQVNGTVENPEPVDMWRLFEETYRAD